MRYDLIVLGHDHLSRATALEAGRRGKKVALIECRQHEVPSMQALRGAAMRLSESARPASSARWPSLEREQAMRQLSDFAIEAGRQESRLFESELQHHGVKVIDGHARFCGPHSVEVSTDVHGKRLLTADLFVVAAGTRPIRPSWVPFDGRTIFDRDELLAMPRLPKSMIVVGADHHALASAMFFRRLGTRLVFVDSNPRLLRSWDRQIVRRFRERSECCGIHFRLGREIEAIEKTRDGRAAVRLQGGNNLLAECVLYAAGNCGDTKSLNLSAAGLLPDEQGRLWCNARGQTWVPHIYGVGEVVGFPVIADATLHPGRDLVECLWGACPVGGAVSSRGALTVPELAMVGATEQQLRYDLVAYEIGIASIPEATRSRNQHSQPEGLLKLLFHRESFELLGVHCVSESATKLIELGETVMSLGGTIESFRDPIFHTTPLAECYRRAAEDGFARVADESCGVLRPPKCPSSSWQKSARTLRLATSPR